MWRSASIWIAAASLAGAWLTAAERPRYGGTLRVKTAETAASLDSMKGRTPLLYETLVTLDPKGQPQARLAVSWKRDPEAKRWEFELRPTVRLHDGTMLEAAALADAWRQISEDFSVEASGNSLIVECTRPIPELPALLAEERFAVALPFSEAMLTGTGPFQVAEFEPGSRLRLAAHEQHWAGRPFLDGVEIEFSLPANQQMFALDAGRADVVGVPSHQVDRAREEGRRLVSTAPIELVALVFNRETPIARNAQLRQAVARAVRRQPVHRILLSEYGEPTGALLPQWLSGYAFLFPAEADIEEARRLVASLPAAARRLRLSHDAGDPFATLLADRVALDLRDAGFDVRSTEGRAELDLSRARIGSSDPLRALARLAEQFGLTWLPRLDYPPPSDMLYEAEAFLLEGQWVIPLFHLPETLAIGPRVRNWGALENVWLAAGESAP